MTTTLARGSEASNKALIIVAVIAGVTLALSLASCFILRSLRTQGHSPKYIPTHWLKNKWRAWTPSSEKRRTSSALQSRSSQITRTPSASNTLNMIRASRGYDGLSAVELGVGGGSSQQSRTDVGIDRNTSIRSIMTLPAYSTAPRDTEWLVAREGERGGIDTVLEFPESIDEEEARREEEMESLFQIRAARREEQAQRRADREAREERRRLRREARDRGDTATLQELRLQNRREQERRAETSASRVADEMIAEHQARAQQRERGRRISSVAYGSLGVARHDGSRVRSDSASSDVWPLLDSAASMGSRDTSRVRARANSAITQAHMRERNLSTSSLSRFTAADYSDDDGSSNCRSRSGSAAHSSFDFVPTPLRGNSHEHEQTRLASVDLNTAAEQQQSTTDQEQQQPPPNYDNLSPVERQRLQIQFPIERMGEAPPYESPTSAPRLPGIARLPSIHITPYTPVSAGGNEGWFVRSRSGER